MLTDFKLFSESEKMKNSDSIHVIGGGVIGLTSAWYLTKAGYDVTVIDRGDMSDGTSHGNAGMIVPSHFVPMAAPGVISQGIKWMFDSKSPFYVKPRLDVDLIRWVWHFYRSCNQSHVARSMPILYEFNEWSKELYREFAEDARFSFCFEEKGLLMTYRKSHQEAEEVALAKKAQQLGIAAHVLSADEVQELEPNIAVSVLGGVYFPGDAHLYPNMFVSQLRKQLAAVGVKFMHSCEVVDFNMQGDVINRLHLQNGSDVPVNEVVLCGGSWTALLLKKLGVKMLLQDGKGYSVTVTNPEQKPSIPTILTEAKVAVTPMGDDLRIGGTLELGGLSTKVNRNRLKGIIESLPKYYPDLKIDEPSITEVWKGYRPCSADGMPYIGRSRKVSNLVVATGHGMMGMSMGPATGQLVAQIIAGEPTTIDLSMMTLERRGGQGA